MNLSDLTKPVDANTVAELIKNQFGVEYKMPQRLKESINLLNKTDNLIVKFKQNNNLHESENNSSYMKLLMVNEAAAKRVSELTSTTQIQESEMKNKLLTKALKIAALGGTLSEEQLNAMRITESMKAVLSNKDTARSFMRKIVESKKVARKAALLENEIGLAQTTIAAQDIADQIQTMIEKFADIKYKELPALHDSIRNAQGVDAAQSFNASVSNSLDELTTSLEGAKGDVNNAVAELTGQEVSAGPNDLDLDGLDGAEGEMDLDLDAELNFDGDAEEEMPADDFDMDLEADDEEIDLGRERR